MGKQHVLHQNSPIHPKLKKSNLLWATGLSHSNKKQAMFLVTCLSSKVLFQASGPFKTLNNRKLILAFFSFIYEVYLVRLQPKETIPHALLQYIKSQKPLVSINANMHRQQKRYTHCEIQWGEHGKLLPNWPSNVYVLGRYVGLELWRSLAPIFQGRWSTLVSILEAPGR